MLQKGWCGNIELLGKQGSSLRGGVIQDDGLKYEKKSVKLKPGIFTQEKASMCEALRWEGAGYIEETGRWLGWMEQVVEQGGLLRCPVFKPIKCASSFWRVKVTCQQSLLLNSICFLYFVGWTLVNFCDNFASLFIFTSPELSSVCLSTHFCDFHVSMYFWFDWFFRCHSLLLMSFKPEFYLKKPMIFMRYYLLFSVATLNSLCSLLCPRCWCIGM